MDSRDPAPPVNFTTARRKDPLRHRRYLHFDERPPRDHLVSRVGDRARVAQWQFLPLLRKVERSKRVRDKDPLTGLFSVKDKIRPICYASHQDAALYATYAAKLSELYEQKLKELGLSDCVTAFREASGKCNIHFALDAFEWIQMHAPCVALAYDGLSMRQRHGLLSGRRSVCSGRAETKLVHRQRWMKSLMSYPADASTSGTTEPSSGRMSPNHTACCRWSSRPPCLGMQQDHQASPIDHQPGQNVWFECDLIHRCRMRPDRPIVPSAHAHDEPFFDAHPQIARAFAFIRVAKVDVRVIAADIWHFGHGQI